MLEAPSRGSLPEGVHEANHGPASSCKPRDQKDCPESCILNKRDYGARLRIFMGLWAKTSKRPAISRPPHRQGLLPLRPVSCIRHSRTSRTLFVIKVGFCGTICGGFQELRGPSCGGPRNKSPTISGLNLRPPDFCLGRLPYHSATVHSLESMGSVRGCKPELRRVHGFPTLSLAAFSRASIALPCSVAWDPTTMCVRPLLRLSPRLQGSLSDHNLKHGRPTSKVIRD